MASLFFRIVAGSLSVTACACANGVTRSDAGGGALQPMAFFTGHTHGEGQLTKLFGKPISVSVDSIGRRQGDMLILDQTIHEGAAPPSVRRWTMKPTTANHYTGTLTDAKGLVNVVVLGSRADIRYTTKAGFDVEQQLVLQSDGKTVLNRLRAHKFGLPVATLSETIRKLS